MNKLEKLHLIRTTNSTIFLMWGEKIKDGRDKTERAEKPYFHCGHQEEKVIKSTQYHLWKEVVVIWRQW